MTKQQRDMLLSKLIDHDKRESKKPGYNRYALAHYCAALTKAEGCCKDGADIRVALLQCFCGVLLDKLLRKLKLPLSTDAEQRGSIYS